MCEMRVIVEQDGMEEILKENITKLEITPNGIKVNSLFEGSSEIHDLVIDFIDFTAGKVVLGREEKV